MLVAGMKKLEVDLHELVAAQHGEQAKLLNALLPAAAKIFDEMFLHFLEEETAVMPVMRKAFTSKEFQPAVDKIIKRTPMSMVRECH